MQLLPDKKDASKVAEESEILRREFEAKFHSLDSIFEKRTNECLKKVLLGEVNQLAEDIRSTLSKHPPAESPYDDFVYALDFGDNMIRIGVDELELGEAMTQIKGWRFHKSARALRIGEFWDRLESLKGRITNDEIVLEGQTSRRLLYNILKTMAELRSEGLVNQP